MEYRLASLVLRCGTVMGLIVTITGLILNYEPVSKILVFLGLINIVITPLISLMFISIVSVLKRDVHIFILSQITIGMILLSILLSTI